MRLKKGNPMPDCEDNGPDDWGCDYCRNDGRLNEDNRCPKCDAIYDDEAPQ